MTALPVPWVISIFALLMATSVLSQPRLPGGARAYFFVAFASAAVATLFAGQRLQHGPGIWLDLQPHVAVLMAPSLWLGFRAFMEPEGWPDRRRATLSWTLVLIAQVAILLPLSWSADIVVTLVTATFTALAASLLHHGQDRFVQVPPEGFRVFRVALAGCVLFLSFVLVSDSAIIVAMVFAGNAGAMRFLAGASGLFVAMLIAGAIIAIPALFRRQAATQIGARDSDLPMPQDEDRELLSKIESVMTETQIYRDPSLTLARLGRRLGCPARSVSIAVNRCTGENVSRYINVFRVHHAAGLLETGDLSVTDVMLESGFLSKSTFNTEFRRVLGKTPSDYRKARQNG